VAGAVYQDHAMKCSQLLAECKPHVFHVPAGTVDQNDGGLGARRVTRKPCLGHVQAHAFDLDELPGGRVRGLNPRDPERRHGHERAEGND
jgi:hypothetical protein